MRAAGTCPECGAAATLKQVGRCVYVSPCGHRYQGRIDAAPALREVVAAAQRLLPRATTTLDPATGLKRVVFVPPRREDAT